MRPLLVGALLALLAYGFIEVRPLLLGPSLVLQSPSDGATYANGLVSVSGSALRASALTLDGAAVLPDQSGRFSSTLAMASGTSILTLVATDRFGRSVILTRTIYVP